MDYIANKKEEPKAFCVTIDSYPDIYAGHKGKILFKLNCASCHDQNMIVDATGPALTGVAERWEGKEAILFQWIRNSQSVIASGDAYAVNLYNEWNKSVMTSFPDLKDEDISEILDYIELMSR